MSDSCNDNRDPLKLVRDGTSQNQRPFQALDPTYAPVNEHTVAHGMVFAKRYAAFLKYYNAQNQASGTWEKFFSQDVSVLLAVAAIQDIDIYRQEVKRYFDFLNNLKHESNEADCKLRLGFLFSSLASLAYRLDELKEALPSDNRLRGVLQNIIKNQLAPHFQRFWAYYNYDVSLGANRLIDDQPAKTDIGTPAAAVMVIFGSPALSAADIKTKSFSSDWPGTNAAPENGYGVGGNVFTRINRLSTNNLFTAIFDQFLRAYARAITEAKAALEASLSQFDDHAPHYALFLAFLKLHEHARAEMNTLTARHLDFYYRKVLGLREKPAVPSHAHLLVTLAKHAQQHELPAEARFTAGKDDLGRDALFKNDANFVANKAKVTALKTVYRHKAESKADGDAGRVFAAPIANSNDGLGAELISEDKSWHPFFNKIYTDGKLSEIRMPKAEVGFAIASHYLFLAGGTRTITLTFTGLNLAKERKKDIQCLFSTEEGWATQVMVDGDTFQGNTLKITLGGNFPPIKAYANKVHGYGLETDLPVMLVKLTHQKEKDSEFLYNELQDAAITQVGLKVSVTGLRTLAVSNDFGEVDTSKPFQPFGAQPLANSSLTIGSKEVFQKDVKKASVNLIWQNPPKPFEGVSPTIKAGHLLAGIWETDGTGTALGESKFSVDVLSHAKLTAKNFPDLTDNEHYNTAARHGFLRLSLSRDFGQTDFQTSLFNYVKGLPTQNPPTQAPTPPVGPFVAAITLDYDATQELELNSTDEVKFNARLGKFFHIAPFGYAEQHPYLKLDPVSKKLSPKRDSKVYLLPQFKTTPTQETEAEFYIGIAALLPPQNVSLLFQVVDGTANPLSEKPDKHLSWSYLVGNEWELFEQNEVSDGTGGLLRSGIVTLTVPRKASNTNTLLPSGSHWIRVSVGSNSDAICRLRLVAAQALAATFADAGNAPSFLSKNLPVGTIAGLEQPDSSVKGIEQPFQTFGGRGQEASAAFYTRISERLRHKDRSVALWDYERLVLEAFPQVHRAKCLPHTQFQPAKAAKPIASGQEAQPAEPAKYRELAAGHTTLVIVPNLQQHNLLDPLRPYASLGLLEEVAAFLHQRTTCFATLHVRNPEFEEVQVAFKVLLRIGYDETFYLKKLKQEITRFLSPWAYAEGVVPNFGGKIYKSVLINFVEELPYVDYVTDFTLKHSYFSIEKNQTETSNDLSEVEPSKAVSILVSVPEDKHIIEPITEAEAAELREKCACQA